MKYRLILDAEMGNGATSQRSACSKLPLSFLNGFVDNVHFFGKEGALQAVDIVAEDVDSGREILGPERLGRDVGAVGLDMGIFS